MGINKNQPFRRRLGFALNGLLAAFRLEHSLRYQAAMLGGVIIVLIVLRLEPLWWALTGASSATVIAAELFNTALEHLTDHLHPEQHPTIALVKDCAAAGVLIACCGALAVAAALVVHLFLRH